MSNDGTTQSPESRPQLDQHRSTSIADDEVDAYLLEMSYQLRTPLSAIVGYSELLMEDPDDADEVQLLAHSIRTATKSLIAVIEKLETQVMRERARRRIAELLQSLSTMVASSLDLEEVITTILDCLDEVIEFDRATVLLAQDDREFQVAAMLQDHEIMWPEQPPILLDDDRRLAQVTDTQAPVVVSDTAIDKRTPLEARESQHRSWLGVPLHWAEETVGVLTLESKQTGRYDAFDARLVNSLGTQAGLAIANARQYGEVQNLATHDALTSALTRRAFFERASAGFEDARNRNRPLSMLMIDLDHFKDVNDTYGHAAGDTVLLKAVQRWKENLRDHDLLGRYGGEEFLVMLPDLTIEDAAKVAERLRRAMDEEPFHTGTESLRVTASIGVAQHGPHVTTLPRLVEEADVALYRAKRRGRNRVETADA